MPFPTKTGLWLHTHLPSFVFEAMICYMFLSELVCPFLGCVFLVFFFSPRPLALAEYARTDCRSPRSIRSDTSIFFVTGGPLWVDAVDKI